PVKPQASAKRKVLQDIKKKRPVSSNWNSRNLVNFDIKAVTTPVAAPIAKDPLKIPRKIPIDLNMAVTSKVWLLSPAGWYAT
ncbi:hypothetical protein LEMLEM_LOCUS17368, partial [Lemmus lemmus]